MFALASPRLRRFVLALMVALGLLTLVLLAVHHGSSSSLIPVRADVLWTKANPII